MKEKHYTVNNTDLFFLTNEHLHSFCISVYIFAGSMYETKNENGISHLYEHTVFRNLSHMHDNGFYALLHKNGLYLDASTYKEFIRFSITGITSGIAAASETLSELLLPISISNEEYETEKERIYAEIRENDSKNTAGYNHGLAFWNGTANEMSITGNKTTVSRVSLKKLNAFRDKIVSSGNLFVYVTGNIGSDGEKLIKKAVSAFPVSDICLFRDNTAPVPVDFCNRNGNIAIKRSDYCIVCISFDIETAKFKRRLLSIIYRTLFSGDDSLVGHALSEGNAYAYSYDCYLEEYANIGRYELFYEVNHKDIIDSISAVISQINRLKIGDFDLNTEKQKETTNYLFMLDEPDNLNWSAAYEGHIIERTGFDPDKKIRSFDRISKDDIAEEAKKIFVKKNTTLSLKGNPKKINTNDINNILLLLDS